MGLQGKGAGLLLVGGLVIAVATCHSGELGHYAAATCTTCPVCPGGAGGVGGSASGGGGSGGGTGGSAGSGGGTGCVVDLSAGLVLHLTMNETTGAVRDAIRDVDCSPRGGPTYRESGLHGSSIYFAGEDGLDCGDLAPLHGLGAITVAAWIFAEDVPSLGMYEQSNVVAKTADDVLDEGFSFLELGSTMAFIMDADEGRQQVFTTTALRAGEWIHVAAVYDGSSLSLFVDGALDATKSAAGTISGGSSSLVVGNNNRTDGSPFGFKGRIDDVRIYDRALCAEELAELAAQQGWLFYTSQASGALELWASHDDGSSPVRLTDNLIGPASARNVQGPLPSWDGRHIAVAVEKNPDGGQDEHYLYVARADGTDLHDLVRMGDLCQGFGWDSRGRIAYVEHVPCEESLYRTELVGSASPELLWAGQHDAINPAAPAPNPADPDDILALGAQCNNISYLQRLEADGGTVTQFPGPIETDPIRWFESGDRFAYLDYGAGAPHGVSVYDLPSMSSTQINDDANPDAGYSWPYPGNGGTRVYALRWDPTGEKLDIVSIEIATGAMQTIVTDVASKGLGWAIIPFDIDRDGDGLGNGIDPTPGG